MQTSYFTLALFSVGLYIFFSFSLFFSSSSFFLHAALLELIPHFLFLMSSLFWPFVVENGKKYHTNWIVEILLSFYWVGAERNIF